jgi:hypothetical protein
MFLCEKVADFHCCEYELYSGMWFRVVW